jgi:hypothetical protein
MKHIKLFEQYIKEDRVAELRAEAGYPSKEHTKEINRITKKYSKFKTLDFHPDKDKVYVNHTYVGLDVDGMFTTKWGFDKANALSSGKADGEFEVGKYDITGIEVNSIHDPAYGYWKNPIPKKIKRFTKDEYWITISFTRKDLGMFKATKIRVTEGWLAKNLDLITLK